MFRPREDREAARADKDAKRAGIVAQLDRYLEAASKAGAAGDIKKEERLIGAAREYAAQHDGLTKAFTRPLEQLIQAMVPAELRRAQFFGHVGQLFFYADRVLAYEGGHRPTVWPMTSDVRTSVETAGQLRTSKRPTATRMAIGAILPGSALVPGFAFQKKETHDDRELYFLAEGSTWAKLVKVDPSLQEVVLTVSAEVNACARRVAQSASQAAPTSVGLVWTLLAC